MERQGATTLRGNPFTLVGDEVAAGQAAPDFTVLRGDLTPYTLSDGQGTVRIFNVIVSIDTPVCEVQTRRFNEEAATLDGVEVLTVSTDLPFALNRWSKESGGDHLTFLSDHRDLSFGEAFGIAVKELRTLGRALFVVDQDNQVIHVQYVGELTEQPDYDAALAAARAAVGS